MFTVPNRCKCQNGSHGLSRLCKAGNSGNEPAELDPAPLSENGFGHCDDTHPFIYELPQDYLGEGLHSTWQDLEYRRPESSICSFAIRGNLESCESKQGQSKEDRAVEMTSCPMYGKLAPIKIERSHQNHFRASISPITPNESRGLSPQVETYRTCLHPYQSAPGVYADLEAAKSDETLLRTQFMQYSNFTNLPGMDGGGFQEHFDIEKSEPWSTFPLSLQPDPYDDEATYSDTPKKSRGAFQQAVMSASCLAVGVGAALDAGSYPWAWSDWNCNEAQSTFSTEQSQPWNETAICHGHTMISSVMFTIATTGLYHLHRDCQHQDHLLFSGITVGIATGLLAGQDLYDAVLELMPWTILLSLLLNMVIKIVLSTKRGSKPDLGKAISESSCRKLEQA